MSKKFLLMGALLCTTRVGADTLFNEKTAVAIGRGDTDTNKGMIHWADCRGQNKQDYKIPPYWVDKSDNCRVRPLDFGLVERTGKYVVADEKKFRTFFPTAKAGDEAGLEKTSNGLELSHGRDVLKLKF